MNDVNKQLLDAAKKVLEKLEGKSFVCNDLRDDLRVAIAAAEQAPRWPQVDMGFGKFAVGGCTSEADGVPGLMYLRLDAPRPHNADCADVFPVGSQAPEDRIASIIHFHSAEALQQTIDVLLEIQSEHYPVAEQAQQITDSTRVAWTSLGTVKAMLPELLASDDVKVRENAQIIDALVKLVGCQQAQQAEPVERQFFAYDPECGFDTFRTEAEAKKYAQDSIDSYREEASEGWSELVNNICWGVVLGATREVELPDEYNGCNGLAGYMKPVDYVLTDAAQPPAVAVAVPELRKVRRAQDGMPSANYAEGFDHGWNDCVYQMRAMLAAAPQAQWKSEQGPQPGKRGRR